MRRVVPDKQLTAIVGKAFDEACDDFTLAISERGFVRTKKRIWVRETAEALDVVSLFRAGSSYGTPVFSSVDIRISATVRVPSETATFLALTGPTSDAAQTRAGKFHLRFNAKSKHM